MLRFFKTSRSLSNSVLHRSNEILTNGNIILYFWEPYPHTVLGLRNKPLFGRLSGGAAGHLSMKINYSNGEGFYVSIWASSFQDNSTNSQITFIEPIVNAKNLEKDIEAEDGRKPKEKIIELNEGNENKLRVSIEKLKVELSKDPRTRAQWSAFNNCSTFIENILYEINIIHTKQYVISTPLHVFNMAEKFEQDIYLHNCKMPSYKD